MPLFQRLAAFTDIHFGKKNNDSTYNQDCLEFVEWFVSESKKRTCDTCIFLGDWHDSRRSLHINTMNYSLRAFEMLNDAFENVYVIMGNHDLFYKERRDVSSLEFIKHLPHIHLIRDPVVLEDVGLSSWLLGDDWRQIRSWQCRYVFGHFELPNFLMNAGIRMPDAGELNSQHFSKFEWVFSGHFHHRQRQGNIQYIGSAFPQNFSDAGDNDRGAMFMDWGNDPEFITWPNQPLYHRWNLSHVLANPMVTLLPRSSLRISQDIPLTAEDMALLRTVFETQWGARRVEFLQDINQQDWDYDDDNEFKTVDDIVLEGLENFQSNIIDCTILRDIYLSLEG